MNRLYMIIALLFILSVELSFGQSNVIVGIDVIDKLTMRKLNIASVELYSLPDTIFVSYFNSGHNSQYESVILSDSVLREFVIKVDNPDLLRYQGNGAVDAMIREMIENQGKYNPQWVPIAIPAKFSGELKAPTAFMTRPKRRKNEIELNEVTVTASKVMFYHKGDTLVYNADAFVLAEGTMLDGLVAQLPGVELKSDGRILCNGRFVDNLLLNGRDLFNSDNQLMLENLAAYTVKDVAVYDKLGRDSELMGENVGDSKYVMDVRLKREYSNGWIVNAEGGYGTNERYLGRLFGLWYTDNASVGMFANANNLNDRSQPGREDGGWSPEKMEYGVASRLSAGLTYTLNGPGKKWEMQGDIKYTGSTQINTQQQTTQYYYDSGDIFTYRWDNSHKKNWAVSTDHFWVFSIPDKVNFIVKPKFSYIENKEEANASEASFSNQMRAMSAALIKNIYQVEDTALNSLVNRYINEASSRGHEASGGLSVSSFIPLVRAQGKRQTLRINAQYDYISRNNNRFNRYGLNIGEDSLPYLRNYQYFHGSPDYDSRGNIALTYQKYFGYSRHIDLQYKYSYNQERRTQLLYMLNQINGFDAFSSPLGVLPSMSEYCQHINASQSFESTLIEHENELSPILIMTFSPGKVTSVVMSVTVPLTLLQRNYTYVQPAESRQQRLCPTTWLAGMNSEVTLLHSPTDKWQSRSTLNASVTPRRTNLYYMIDIVNDTDPLNITVGNPDLKSAHDISISLNSNFWKSGVATTHSARLSFVSQINQLAQGSIYDTHTGVRTYRTYNINGNWKGDASYSLFTSFGAYRKFDLSSSSNFVMVHSVDLVGTQQTEVQRRIVDTYTAKENIKFNWKTGRHQLTARADIAMNRTVGREQGFTNFTSWVCNYSAAALFNLPYNWSISTDIGLYTRRGFIDTQLNTTDVIWNMRLTKSILKGQLVLMADGYDMLQQLSNVAYTINAQARAETVYNVIPAYILLHLQWHFNQKPHRWG